MLIRDFRESRSQLVNLDIVAVRPDRLRMEVTTPIGIHLASFVMSNNEFRCALPQQKKFVSGIASEKSLAQIIGKPLDPTLFMNLLFDDAPSSPGWQCQKDKNQFLASCENKAQNIKLTWKDREVARRKVEVETKQYSLQIILQGFSTKVEETADTFVLNAPEGFKTERFK